MTIEYTWDITSIKKLDNIDSLQDVIYEVSWKKIGTDSETGLQGVFETSTKFPVENININNFIPFQNLTKENIIDWLKTIVIDGYELEVNYRIKRDIDSKRSNITTINPSEFPWQS
jgi:hypothetical protein